MEYPVGKGRVTYDGSKRETVDMGTNNFLIEIVFKADPSQAKGTLAAKVSESGYDLAISPEGTPSLTLKAGSATAVATAKVKVNDGKWHHLIAEVDRTAGQATFYVDGKAAGESRFDSIPHDAALSNTADFIVGKGFTGAIDFLRVCRSTLAESKTTIDELFTWEFNGPALRDFAGRLPAPGQPRDAGALAVGN
jgi:hypothetical protein